MKKECVIIGAGPAGSLAAKELAERGIETLVIERKQEIGPPKRCAEGVTIRGLEIVGIKINQKCIAGDIKGAFLYSPSGKKVEMMGEEMEGYVLERKIFENFISISFILNGFRLSIHLIFLLLRILPFYPHALLLHWSYAVRKL